MPVSLKSYFYFQLISNAPVFSYGGERVVYQLSSCSCLINRIALQVSMRWFVEE